MENVEYTLLYQSFINWLVILINIAWLNPIKPTHETKLASEGGLKFIWIPATFSWPGELFYNLF